MLFNTYEFIFLFLPITLVVYFLFNHFRFIVAAKCWLAASSLFFYSYWEIRYLPLLLGSIAFNYSIGRWIQAYATKYPERIKQKRYILTLGIVGNVALLAYYKYADFFLTNVNAVLGTEISLLHFILPLGISFFTFTQIAFLVDAFKGKAKEYNIVSYILFVTFYPHLIAGPILHHKEMMPQFDSVRNKRWNWKNASTGIYIFCIGLFKKVVIADTFAIYANDGFAHATNFIDSWVASLSYTFQLYFDFSGYTDMAIGAALLFNIRLPQNFNSPYKALNIQDFWRRWHMTLSRFLRDYIYIPLGGNRRGEPIMLRNIMIVFLVGGLWHGAGWTFIIWGFLHGFGQVVHRLWGHLNIKMPKWLAWGITFFFINLTWVFFRAESFAQAMRIIKGMFGFNQIGLTLSLDFIFTVVLLVIALILCIAFPSSSQITEQFKPSIKKGYIAALLFVIALIFLNRVSEFLYFNF